MKKLKTLIFFTLITTTINAQTYENKGGGIYIANENGITYTKQENTSGLKSMVGFYLDSVSIKNHSTTLYLVDSFNLDNKYEILISGGFSPIDYTLWTTRGSNVTKVQAISVTDLVIIRDTICPELDSLNPIIIRDTIYLEEKPFFFNATGGKYYVKQNTAILARGHSYERTAITRAAKLLAKFPDDDIEVIRTPIKLKK